jgi:hypothetical protein
VLLSSIVVMEIAGPFAVRWGLRFAGDAAPVDLTATTRMVARVTTGD